MTAGTGGGKTVAPQMNVTPLVDVVLVLLIIFMVITPLLTKTFWIHTPKQEKEEVTKEDLQKDPTPPLVMRVGPNRSVQVNGAEVPFEELSDRLRRMFAARDDHVLFFDAADDAEYGFTVAAMDKAREGGAVTIAALTQALSAAAGEQQAPAPAN
jgi:biopolymer transport protein ExbD/biopolymer transport protein TolR